MSFYYLSKEMGLALNNILSRVCSNDKEYLNEDFAITWINYKSEKNNLYKGYGCGINNRKKISKNMIFNL